MRRPTGALILVLLAWAFAGPVLAATDEAVADTTGTIDRGVPQMQGHRFVPAPLVPSPFINTYLRNTLGMASAKDVSTPPIIIDGNEIPGLVGNLNAVILAFEYQLALKRWLAVRGQVGLAGKFGTGVQTLLAEGIGTSVEFEFGWVFSLHRGERTRLSGAMSISNRSVNIFSVFNLVSDIVEGTNYGLSQTTPVLSGEVGLRFAWALSELIGLTSHLSAGNGDTLDRSSASTGIYRAGLALSFDLDRYSVPMGVVLGGSFTDFNGNDVGDTGEGWETGVRVSYIGRESFLISLDFNWADLPTTGLVEAFSANWVALSLRYYF